MFTLSSKPSILAGSVIKPPVWMRNLRLAIVSFTS